MSNAQFATQEEENGNLKFWSLLLRYIYSMPLLIRLIVPAIILASIGTLLPLLVYLFLISLVARTTGWIVFEVGGQLLSGKLHARMIAGLAHVRSTYFDENPSGRLLNKVTGDFENLRTMGVIRMGDSTNAAIEIFFIAIVVMFANPWAAFLMIPSVAAFFYLQTNIAPMVAHGGLRTAVRRGEVLHREADIIEGARVFEMYGRIPVLTGKLKHAFQSWCEINIVCGQIDSWARFWMGTLATLYIFLSMIIIVTGLHNGWVSATLAAVVFSSLFRLGAAFNWLYWITLFLNETISHAHRVFSLVDLQDERLTECATPLPAVAVPSQKLRGDIQFHDYRGSYRPKLAPVLNGLNVAIQFGKHTGIVGRTGTGKSSLVQSLYRMLYVVGGDITIGGQSIFTHDIDFIRSHFAMVPQDPYLFEGTLRSNLDRYNEHSDKEIENALLEVGFSSPPDLAIAEGGQNLSLGQRQLVCLARALLSTAPFIVMDEPTSGVDTISDAAIQRVLQTSLHGRTVITIAHRLETLQRCDAVIQIEGGMAISSRDAR